VMRQKRTHQEKKREHVLRSRGEEKKDEGAYEAASAAVKLPPEKKRERNKRSDRPKA